MDTEEFRKGIKRVGARSSHDYRSIFDPIKTADIKSSDDRKRIDCTGRPALVIIAGPNGSGKSSVVSGMIGSVFDETIINPDNYAKGLSEVISDRTERYTVAMNVCGILRESLLDCHTSFGSETVGSMEDKVKFVRKAVDKGYDITLIYVALDDPELCLERIRKRVSEGGHDVDPDKVRSRYLRSMVNLHKFLELADRADVYDNSGSSPQLVFMKKDGEYQLSVDPGKYEWVNTYILEYFKDAKRSY
ncbi:MAG: zeta toxin family protein [Candidatus Methanoplasma sp.]|nr:zeta toxin family protein [Candidatus Methanoplasma sp.]